MTLWTLALAAGALAGNWSVDLRPNPQSPPYSKPMVLAVAGDGTISGEFYGTPIASGRAADSNGRACFAFTTADQAGAYQHSGCLKGDAIEGLSWSEGRKVLLAWSATRDSR